MTGALARFLLICLVPICLVAGLATPVRAVELALPINARLTVERNTSPDLYAAPIGVFANDTVPVQSIEGDVRRGAWRLGSPGLTPLQVMAPLRKQLSDAGFEIVLDCASAACGGFDFRFATETLPGPNMYVNIRAFHFVTARRAVDGAPQEIVTVLTSTTATSAYVQIIQASLLDETPAQVESDPEVPSGEIPVQPQGIEGSLRRAGHLVLSDLDFDSGTTQLGAGPFATLQGLAGFLQQNPQVRVALVGHTDTVGGLQANIAISRERAQSVRQRLIDAYDIAPGRLDAEAVGFLSPLTSNTTDAGRTTNRRVEVVLLPDAE
jgi:outer membrane protein OmpA-like peptidoglycan-associated protein